MEWRKILAMNKTQHTGRKSILSAISLSEKILLCLCFAIAMVTVVDTVYHLVLMKGLGTRDFAWIWAECAVAIRGYDVYEVAKSGEVVADTIQLNPYIATVPWGRIIGNLLHPGFLSFPIAWIYGVSIYLLIVLWAWYKLIPYAVQISPFTPFYTKILCVLFVIMPIYWANQVGCWNNGVVLAYLSVLACIYCEEGHENLAGFLLALASLKPQITGVFFLAILIRKHYRTIAFALLVILASWGIYSVSVANNPWMDLFSMVNGQTGNKLTSEWWFGWFEFICVFGFSYRTAMLLSMFMGIILTSVSCFCFLKSRKRSGEAEKGTDLILYYSIPAAVSMVWCYKSVSDWLILSFLNLLVFYIIGIYGDTRKNYLIAYVYLALMNINVFSGVVRRVLGYSWATGITLDAWMRMSLYLIILLFITKNGYHSAQNG